MSNVIRFLESMGANATAARMSIADYDAAVRYLDLGPEQQTALINRDAGGFCESMSVGATMYCLVVAPEEQEERAPGEEPNSDEVPGDEGLSQSE
jgi:hypothetical protein